MDAVRVAVLREILSTSDWLGRTRGFARSLRGAVREEGSLLLVGTPEDEPWHFAAHLDDEARMAGILELTPTLVRHQVPQAAPPHLSVGMDRLEVVRRGEAVVVVAPSAAPEGLLERVNDARRIGATVLAVHGGDRELDALAHEALTVNAEDLGVLPQAARAVLLPSSGPPPRPAAPVLTDGEDEDHPLTLSPWRIRALDGPGGAAGRDTSEVHGRRTPDGNAPSPSSPRNPAAHPCGDDPEDIHALSFEAVQHLVSSAAGETPAAGGRGRLGFRDRLAQLLDIVSGPAPQRH